MTTLKTVSMVVAGMIAGFAIATWMPGGEPTSVPSDVTSVPVRGRDVPAPVATRPSDREADLAARLARVEETLRAELAERASLEARVEDLAVQVTARAAPGEGHAAPRAADAPPAAGGGPRRAPSRGEFTADLPERLVAAGFSTDRAQWITERLEQLPMEALRAQYEARRGGAPAGEPPVAFERTLRSELGDADYERYLQAVGRPTAVNVRGVLASSPAEQAGLREGDQIVAYGGQRVFDSRDLNRLTFEGTPGEPMLVDVLRNGQHIQVVIPRGPVGITGGRFRGP